MYKKEEHNDQKSVGIKELKNKLSSYLKEVKSGTHLLITDRDKVIAEVREAAQWQNYGIEMTTVQTWEAQGKVTTPLAPHAEITAEISFEGLIQKPVQEGTSNRLLSEDRGH